MKINPTHYTYRVFWSEEDAAYVGTCSEFSLLSHLDETPDKAFDGIMQVVADAIGILQEEGASIPEPLAKKRYSGRFQVRVTPEVHRNLVMQAAELGVSLNRHIASRLT